jgi:hypothetical protein
MSRFANRLLLAALAAAVAVAGDDDKAGADKKPVRPPSDLLAGVPPLDRTSRYLERIVELRKRQAAAAGEKGADNPLDQLLAAEEATVGRHREAMRLMDTVFPTFPDPKDTALLDPYEPKDAVETILALAEKRQVVMINEAHHVARHRAFATLLLEGLRGRGFRYFAAETFSQEDMAALAKRGYPTLKTGYYCCEPVFGDLVRTAVRLGYTAVAYEHRFEKPPTAPADAEGMRRQLAEREQGQAKNLKARIFDLDPKARVVVFAGYSHIRKVPQASRRGAAEGATKWMACRFQELTGIEPLSVDQTVLMEHARPACEHPAYRRALEKKKVTDRPVVLFDGKAGRSFVPEEDRVAFDLLVCHPRDTYPDGRPAWLRMGGYRRPVKLAGLPRAPRGGSLLAQAFVQGEDEAIAVDQFEYGPADPDPVFLLPAGAYTIRVVDAAGKTVQESKTTVE